MYAESYNLKDIDGHDANITSDSYLTIKTPGSVKFVELFEHNSIDTVNKWTETIAGSATKTFANTRMSMNVTTNSADSIQYVSKQNILPSTGQSFNRTIWVIHLDGVTEANNIREWGVDGTGDGYLFRLTGSTLEAVASLGGSETKETITTFTMDDEVHKYEIRRTGLTIGEFFVDNELVATILYASVQKVGSKCDTLYIANRNTDTLTSGTSIHIISGQVIDENGSSTIVTGRDDNGLLREVAVDSARRLLVSQEPPAPPPGKTEIGNIQQSDVSGVDDDFTVIPTGEAITIQRVSGGSQYVNGGTKVEIWYAPNGNTTGLELIDAVYINGNSDQIDPGHTTEDGDGTKAILLRRSVFSGGSIEILGKWVGYY